MHSKLKEMYSKCIKNKYFFFFCLLLYVGACAGIVDIGTSWLSDLKLGVCKNAFWLNREECCWIRNTTLFGSYNCSEWVPWSALFNHKSPDDALAYVIAYLMFVVWGVGLATITVLLVRMFAPYACGSGIPEVGVYC